MSAAPVLAAGGSPRAVFTLAWPIMVSMLTLTLMAVFDAILVSRLGTAPLAGVGLAAALGQVFFSLMIGLLDGAKVSVAHHTGADDRSGARRVAVAGLWLGLTSGLLVLLVGQIGHGVFAWYGAGEEVAGHASLYFRYRLAAAPMVALNVAAQAWFQGRGETQVAMRSSVIANLGVVILEPLLVYGLGPVPAFGVAGPGLGVGLGHLMGFLYLLKRIWPVLQEGSLRPEREALAAVLRLGGPIGLRMALDVGSFAVLAPLLAWAGQVELAAHMMGVRLVAIAFLPGYAIHEATSILVGQAVGAQRAELAEKATRSAARLAAAVMGGLGLLYLLIPDLLMQPFAAEAAVAERVKEILLLAALWQVGDALALVWLGALNGLGDTRGVLLLSVGAAWLVKLPLAFLLVGGAGMGVTGAWVGILVEIAVLAALGWWRLRSSGWAPGVKIAISA